MPEAVLLAGGSSAAGLAVAEALLERGEQVVIASRGAAVPDALARFAEPGAEPGTDGRLHCLRADLSDEAEVAELRRELGERGVRIDRLVHLVGGWAGGRGIPGQSEEGYRRLAASLDALRTVSRAFYAELAEAESPRVIAVSSPAAQRPAPGGANYAAVKAGTEAWTLALDAALRADAAEGAASIIVTDSLSGRAASFARVVLETLDAPATRVGGQRVLHL